MGSYRLVLSAALLTALITATLTAALASFAAGALPRAVHRQLAAADGTSIVMSGAVNAPVARRDDRVVRRSMVATFGAGAVTVIGARWSDPLALAGPARDRVTRLAVAAAPDGVTSRASLTAGHWPGAPAAAAIPAAVPAAVVRRLGLALGAVVALRDRDTGARVRLRITGVFQARDPAAGYWQLDPSGAGGADTSGGFVTYGPLIVNPAAFSDGDLSVGGATWIAAPRTGRIPAGDLALLASRVGETDRALQRNAQLGGLQVTTSLPAVLDGIAADGVVARSLLAIGALQLLLLAVAALALAAGLLASQRAGESALLGARGGARWQLARLSWPESALIAVAAAAVGALAGGWLATALARSGPLRAAGLRLPPAPAAAWWAAGAIGVLCVTLLLWPALRAPAAGGTRGRLGSGRLGRPARAAAIARAGADLALLAIALVAIWQLRRYRAVASGATGGLTIDPVLTAAPVLALAAGTLVLLRLLPVAARIGDRLAARSRRLGAAMASWQVSRRPLRQGASVLLVVLAAATSTLVLAQHQSWRRSVDDQAAFSVGADVRVDTPGPIQLSQAAAITAAPGVLDAMPVARIGDTGPGEVLAVGAQTAAPTVLVGPDFSRLSPAAIWRPLVPVKPGGLALPGEPARLAVSASLSRSAARLSPMLATLDVTDAAGVSYSVPAGQLPADGRSHRLIAVLAPVAAIPRGQRPAGPANSAASAGPANSAASLASAGPANSTSAGSAPRGPDYPLRLTGITLSYPLPVARTRPAVLVIRGISTAGGPTDPAGTTGAAGTFAAPFATGRALQNWAAPMSAPGLALAIQDGRGPGQPRAGPQDLLRDRPGRGGELIVFEPGYGAIPDDSGAASEIQGTLTLAAPPAAEPIPAIATRAYLSAADVSTGDAVTLTFGTASVRARIIAAVTRFPTVTGAGGALIINLATVTSVLTSESAAILPVMQWWLRTRRQAVPGGWRTGRAAGQGAGHAAGLPPGTTVTADASTAAALLADPLSGLPQQALPAIALAAAALAAVGFSVSVTASVRERRASSALLAALGVSRTAQARQLCLEQLMLSLPAAAAGLLLGAGLARLLIQAVTLTATAAPPVPPAAIEIPWALAAGLAAAVATVPVIAAALTVARRPDPAAQLRAAETP
jgi:ABC-type antimicrobial peptide transport system permease subunit